MLEINVSVKIEGLERLADAIFALAGIGRQVQGNVNTTLDEKESQTAVPAAQTAQPAPTASVSQPAIPVAQTASTAQSAVPTTAVPTEQPAVPVDQTAQTAVPATQTAASTAQSAVPTASAPQTAVPIQAQGTVPVSNVTYSIDDLAHAAMALMDAGRQADLQLLLTKFGVESLPQLPPGHYGAFAAGLREMGAQI